MVTPQWGAFQKPHDTQQESLEQEYSQEVPGQIQDEETPEGDKPQWGNFSSPQTYQGEPDPIEEEGIFNYLGRNFISNASRVVETIAGRAGNIEKFAKDTLTSLPQTGGIISWGLSKLMGPERWERLVKGPKDQQQQLPTSEMLKEASKAATGGYTKPRTTGERQFQGFTEDITSVLSGRRPAPTAGRSPAAQQAINALLIPAATNVTKKVVEDVGFGEDKANMAKMAVWLPLSLYFNTNAPAYASNLMNQGRNGLPNTLQANVPRFIQRLDALEASPLMLSSDPRNALARQMINGVREDIANGQTNVQSLMTMYDGINAAKRNRGLFDLHIGDQRFARNSIDMVRNAVRDEIIDLGANHPEAIQAWQDGLRAWASIHQSRAVTEFVESIAKGPYAKILSAPAAALFGLGSYGAVKYMPPFMSIGTTAAVPAAYKTGQVFYRMYNNETLRDYYWRAISAAQQQNAPAFIHNYQKLNKELEKSPVKPVSKKQKK